MDGARGTMMCRKGKEAQQKTKSINVTNNFTSLHSSEAVYYIW